MSIHADVFSALNRAENLMVLEPGYWYGRTVHFMLFDEHFTGLGPECVEATLRLHAFDGGVVARERIRAVRPPSLDGGTREDPSSSPDAGSFANPPGSR